MRISPKSKDYIIPEYSLTGDLLSFLTCNLQYRYQNKGSLPPSRPLQIWFGDFIHALMEEAYSKWQLEKTPFPWDWLTDIRPLEEKIDERMQARGLYPPSSQYFTSYKDVSSNTDSSKKIPLKRIVSTRSEMAINLWGKHLFPLIESAEVLIKGLRKMPLEEDEGRSDFYSVNGVIDVLSSLNINSPVAKDNLILDYLKKEEFFKKYDESKEYEIIIDYKGMKRPQYDSNQLNNDSTWNHHSWQILTYSWLRCKQSNSRPIIAGIIFYLNELLPSIEDLLIIKDDIKTGKTDVNISEEDKELILAWDGTEENFPKLSDKFKLDRSIRIVEINDDYIKEALKEFDTVVNAIEKSTLKESSGTPIKQSWNADGDARTCRGCDFKFFCNKHKDNSSCSMTVP
jgi:hypothetical protein